MKEQKQKASLQSITVENTPDTKNYFKHVEDH